MFNDFDNLTGEMLGILSIALLIGLTILILFLVTLQNCLKNISPENRKMPPANVWLMLIPLFSMVYQFIMVGKIADSLQAEFAKRGMDVGEARPSYNIGLAFCICSVAGYVIGRVGNEMAAFSGILSLGGLVCLIIYWVKVSNYSKQLGPSDGNDNILDRNI